MPSTLFAIAIASSARRLSERSIEYEWEAKSQEIISISQPIYCSYVQYGKLVLNILVFFFVEVNILANERFFPFHLSCSSSFICSASGGIFSFECIKSTRELRRWQINEYPCIIDYRCVFKDQRKKVKAHAWNEHKKHWGNSSAPQSAAYMSCEEHLAGVCVCAREHVYLRWIKNHTYLASSATTTMPKLNIIYMFLCRWACSIFYAFGIIHENNNHIGWQLFTLLDCIFYVCVCVLCLVYIRSLLTDFGSVSIKIRIYFKCKCTFMDY